MTDDKNEASFDSAAPSAEDLQVSIKRMVDAWNSDWSIIINAVAEQTGMTRQEVMMWEMVTTWNDMVRHIRANFRWTRAWLEQHGEEPPEAWRE